MKENNIYMNAVQHFNKWTRSSVAMHICKGCFWAISVLQIAECPPHLISITEQHATYRNSLDLCKSFGDLLEVLFRSNGLKIIVHYPPANHMNVKCHNNVSGPNNTCKTVLQTIKLNTIIVLDILNKWKIHPIPGVHTEYIFLYKQCISHAATATSITSHK